MIYKIPVTWEAFGVVEIEAPNLEAAITIFDERSDYIPLPEDSDYVDGSFRREDEETIKLNNNL